MSRAAGATFSTAMIGVRGLSRGSAGARSPVDRLPDARGPVAAALPEIG